MKFFECMHIIENKKILKGVLCALGCEILFGVSYVFTKNATSVAGELDLLGWRFFIAFIIMLLCIVTGIVKVNLRGKNLKPLVFIAIFSPCVYFIGETIGIISVYTANLKFIKAE